MSHPPSERYRVLLVVRAITLTMGTNRLVGTDPERIIEGWTDVQRGVARHGSPPLWDGQAARRIVAILCAYAARRDALTGAHVVYVP